jgi:putative tryptophan/tyrosine transport system substrate-binding protein
MPEINWNARTEAPVPGSATFRLAPPLHIIEGFKVGLGDCERVHRHGFSFRLWREEGHGADLSVCARLLNPENAAVTETTLRNVQEATPTLGLQIQILNASTIGEIDAAFASLAHERPDAPFVAGDAFFVNQRVQLAALTVRDGIPAAYSVRELVAAGGLMSYGTDLADTIHQIGAYTGRILKGAKAAELPVLQSTKFDFIINLKTARVLGIEVPSALLLIADEVIE